MQIRLHDTMKSGFLVTPVISNSLVFILLNFFSFADGVVLDEDVFSVFNSLDGLVFILLSFPDFDVFVNVENAFSVLVEAVSLVEEARSS